MKKYRTSWILQLIRLRPIWEIFILNLAWITERILLLNFQKRVNPPQGELEEYKSGDISETSVADFYELRSKAVEVMLKNDIEHIAVTNGAGDFVGIASLQQVKNE